VLSSDCIGCIGAVLMGWEEEMRHMASRLRIMVGMLGVALLLLSSTVGAVALPDGDASKAQAAFDKLAAAENWRDAQAAADALGAAGPDAFPILLEGTSHKKDLVREHCYNVLMEKFPDASKTIDALIRGLKDSNQSIRYTCAFHLGEQLAVRAKGPLREVALDPKMDELTRYGAAKSLAEIGQKDVIRILYWGLGSDDFYPRYLSGIGIKALCGKDLTDFGYGGPTENDMVSAPAVMKSMLRPIEDAEVRAKRWQALADLCKWLKETQPDLYAELAPSPG
jgi:hypothetical protein